MEHRPEARPSPIWEQWLDRLNSTRTHAGKDFHKLEALEVLNKNKTPSLSQWQQLTELVKTAVHADAVLLVEKIAKPHAKAGTVSQIKIHYSSFGRRMTQQLIKEPSFVAALAKLARTHRPTTVRLTSIGLPVAHLQTISLTSGLSLLTLSSVLLPKLDQKFLRLFQNQVDRLANERELSSLLSAETERLSTLTHHLSEGLVILDKDLRVTLWNRPLQRLIGISPLEAEHKPYTEVLRRSNDPDWLRRLLDEYQRNPLRNVFTDDIQIRTAQNTDKWVNISGSFLRNPQGEIVQTIIILRDISRTKELEDRKNEFISIATHELRTPITAIKGYLTLLQKRAAHLGEKEQIYLARALEANDRLVRLAEDLLQVTHVEENRVQFSLRPINVVPLLHKVVTDLAQKAEKKGLELRLESPAFSAIIAADPTRLEQVFANLVDNAIKYTAKGKVTVTIEQQIDRATHDRHLEITVRDTGIGLSTTEAQEVFEKFHRAQSARQSSESGAGLGLFIVKSFVEKQGGTIKVKSKPGHGSQFSVIFPAVEAKALGRKK